MELRVLQYFLAVAREQNISAAAQSLHLTQPTLSRQLKELEEELGKQLMIRGNRKIVLTQDGMLLRKRAEEILELVDRTEKEVMCSDEIVSGDIYIGTGETDGVRQIVRSANHIQAHYPGIHFHIVSGDAVDVCERLDKGLLDFGVLLGDIDKIKLYGTAHEGHLGSPHAAGQSSGIPGHRFPTGPLGQAADPLPAGGQQKRAVPLAAEGTFRAAHRSDL